MSLKIVPVPIKFNADTILGLEVIALSRSYVVVACESLEERIGRTALGRNFGKATCVQFNLSHFLTGQGNPERKTDDDKKA